MEEKERFELFGEHCIKDNSPDARPQLLDAYKACVILNEQTKRIKELEQENLSLQEQSIRDNQNWIEETTQLKQQLTEKDKRLKEIDDWKYNYGYTNYDDIYMLEDLQSRAFQSEDDTTVVNELLDYLNISDENEILPTIKQQLAEKEKEIEISKSTIDFYKSYYISFKEKVIEQLEKVKNEIIPIFCVPGGIYSNLHNEVFKKIDNQINELKEGVKNE